MSRVLKPSIIRKKLSNDLTVLLLKGDLPDDSSDEEYVPSDGYNSDDDELQVLTIDKNDFPETSDDEENEIAKRTRSKLSLNDISIEAIEQELVPPDITPDMYDLNECDDELWTDFLKCFQQPLVNQSNNDDDDDDSEYVASGDENSDLDVNVRERRSTNKERKIQQVLEEIHEIERKTFASSLPSPLPVDLSINLQDICEQDERSSSSSECLEIVEALPKSYENFFGNKEQMLLFESQIRCHIQLLVQSFLVFYDEKLQLSSKFDVDYAEEFKKLLNDCSELLMKSTRTDSLNFNGRFCDKAVKFVEEWKTKAFTDKDLDADFFVHSISRSNNDYVMNKKGYSVIQKEVFMKSWLFIYPELLPGELNFDYSRSSFKPSEDWLIASGMLDFAKILENDEEYMKEKKSVLLQDLSTMIAEYYFPYRNPKQIFRRMSRLCGLKANSNPVQYCYCTKQLAPIEHQVFDLKTFGILAPVDRNIYSLPVYWRSFAAHLKKHCKLPSFSVEMSEDGSFCIKEVIDAQSNENVPKRVTSTIISSEVQKKKSKISKKSMNCMLTSDKNEFNIRKADNYAEAYFDKVRRQLRTECLQEFEQFVKILNDFDERTDTVQKLYEDIVAILRSTNHIELCDEFITFLTPEQANDIGKFVPHCLYTRMLLFLNKLEIYYKHQPGYLGRMLNVLNDLVKYDDDDDAGVSLSLDKLQATFLPLVKGNALLCDWFMEIFPEAVPPESLMTDWEVVNLNKEVKNDEMFEYVTLPEAEDLYGNANCRCDCHNVDDNAFQNRSQHCVNCGLKFIHGKMYVQIGKCLKLAQPMFQTSRNIFVDGAKKKKKN